MKLTGIKGDFADHNPFGSEMKLNFHKSTNTMMQFNGNISGIFENSVFDVGVADGLSFIFLSAYTEHYLGFGEYL